MFTVYVKPGCPYCAETIHTLKSKKVKHKIVELKTEARREKIKEKHKYNTFPQVFYKKNLIGGNTELQSIVESCNQMNILFDSIEPKKLKIILEICCSLSNKKNTCALSKIMNSNSNKKKIIKRRKK